MNLATTAVAMSKFTELVGTIAPNACKEVA